MATLDERFQQGQEMRARLAGGEGRIFTRIQKTSGTNLVLLFDAELDLHWDARAQHSEYIQLGFSTGGDVNI